MYSESRDRPYSFLRRFQIAGALSRWGIILSMSAGSREWRRASLARAWRIFQKVIAAWNCSPIGPIGVPSSSTGVGSGSLPSTISRHLCTSNVASVCIAQRRYSLGFNLFNVIVFSNLKVLSSAMAFLGRRVRNTHGKKIWSGVSKQKLLESLIGINRIWFLIGLNGRRDKNLENRSTKCGAELCKNKVQVRTESLNCRFWKARDSGNAGCAT